MLIFLQTCGINYLLSGDHSTIFRGCSGHQVLVSSIEDPGATHYATSDLVLLRAGFLKEDTEADLDICEKHLKELTNQFKSLVGHRYCSRSSGITSSKKGATPNDFSRIAWNCRGKKSMKR